MNIPEDLSLVAITRVYGSVKVYKTVIYAGAAHPPPEIPTTFVCYEIMLIVYVFTSIAITHPYTRQIFYVRQTPSVFGHIWLGIFYAVIISAVIYQRETKFVYIRIFLQYGVEYIKRSARILMFVYYRHGNPVSKLIFRKTVELVYEIRRPSIGRMPR